jgi:hypothetical protein
MQGENQKLKEKVQQLEDALKSAHEAYLPPWSHGYYDKVAYQAEPLLKYHREVRKPLR